MGTLIDSGFATPGANGGVAPAVGLTTTGANLLVASVSWYSGGGTTSLTVSDTYGNTWTPLTLRDSSSSAQRFFYVKNPTVGTGHQVTVTGSFFYPVITFWAFAGADLTAPFEAENGATASGSSGPLSTGSVTPAANGAIVVSGWAGMNGTSNPVVASPLTQTTNQSPVGAVCVAGGAGYQLQTTAAAVNPSWSWTGSDNVAAAVAVFKAAALTVNVADTITVAESVAHGQIARVNFVEGVAWDGGTGTTYASPAQNVTAGNTLVACIGGYTSGAGQSVTGVTDTAGNTYVKVDHVINAGDSYREEIWVAANIAGHASNVVTATWSAAVSFRGIVVRQYRGLDAVTPLDDTEQYVGNAPHTTPSLTGTTAESVHILMSRWGFGTTVFPAGFTEFTTPGAGVPEVADKIVTGGAFTGTYTVTSANYFVIAAIFKAAGPVLSVNVADTLTVADSVTAAAGGPRQVFTLLSTLAPSGAVDSFGPISGPLQFGSSEGSGTQAWAVAGVFTNLVVQLNVAPGVGKSWTFALRVNGATTALTCTISDTATTARDTTHRVTVAPGDRLTLISTPSGSPTTPGTSGVQVGLEFLAAAPGESGYGIRAQTIQTGGAATRYASALSGHVWTTDVADVTDVVPLAGTITALYLHAPIAPTSGRSDTVTLYLNGVKQDGSGGTVNTTASLTAGVSNVSSSFSLPVAAGDTLYLEGVKVGTGSEQTAVGVRVVAAVATESIVAGGTTGSTAPSVTTYTTPAWGDSVWTGTEANVDEAGTVTPLALRRLYVRLSAAPGSGKQYTFSLRVNAASPSGTLSATVSDLATGGSDLSGLTVIGDGNTWTMRAVPSGTPTVVIARWAMVQTVITTLTPTVADSVGVAEAVTAAVRTVRLTPRPAETIGVTDSVTAALVSAAPPLTVSRADAVTITDSVTAALGTVRLTVSRADTITVATAVVATLQTIQVVSRSVADTIGVTDGTLVDAPDQPISRVWPTGAVMIAPPSQVHSLGAAISVNGPIWSSEYPLRNLVDGSSDQPCRFAWGTVQITLDLGAAVTPTLVGLLNHNIDVGRVIGITNEQGLNRGFGGRDPNCWIDLRGFPTTARYWTLAINDNSVPVSIGEIVIATMTEFRHGLWEGEPGFTEKLTYPGYRETTEYLKAYISTSGALLRTAEPQVRVNDDDWLQLEDIATEVLAVTGRRVLVVPSSRINDVWFCDWPTTEEVVYENPMERTLRLTLLEVVGSVLNGR